MSFEIITELVEDTDKKRFEGLLNATAKSMAIKGFEVEIQSHVVLKERSQYFPDHLHFVAIVIGRKNELKPMQRELKNLNITN